MSTKHTSPEWRRTVKHVRAQARATWARGDEVECWRCGRPIEEGQAYDVGHINHLDDDNSIANAAPEHRRENRSHGGRLGAAITNACVSASPA